MKKDSRDLVIRDTKDGPTGGLDEFGRFDMVEIVDPTLLEAIAGGASPIQDIPDNNIACNSGCNAWGCS